MENSAAQTEKAMDSLLVTMRSGNRGLNLGRNLTIEDADDSYNEPRRPVRTVTQQVGQALGEAAAAFEVAVTDGDADHFRLGGQPGDEGRRTARPPRHQVSNSAILAVR